MTKRLLGTAASAIVLMTATSYAQMGGGQGGGMMGGGWGWGMAHGWGLGHDLNPDGCMVQLRLTH